MRRVVVVVVVVGACSCVLISAYVWACFLCADEFKGYVFKITGGHDKQGFAMKQGVLTRERVRLLLSEGKLMRAAACLASTLSLVCLFLIHPLLAFLFLLFVDS